MVSSFFITARPWISSIPQELHLINTECCISSLGKQQYTCVRDDIQGRLAALDDIRHTACGGEMPLLSQWIKKKSRMETILLFFFGAGGEIRTHDLLITNQLHYPCATPATRLL